ncbi:hypothetical protein [Cohnella yongneupensis]|uniref:Uncharacterized protein n=1 Tax=Cohnella yongneupensis TaxID=425006 RepID=A0ABW0R3V3_9BACL
MKQSHNGNPEPDFSAWSDRIERYLRRGILILAILLCLSQLVLQFPAVRYWMTTTDESEGVPFPGIAP